MSHARDTAICRNEICAWNGAARTVEWPVVASGAYLRGELRCACGWAMELLPEPVRPITSQPAPVEPPVAPTCDHEAQAISLCRDIGRLRVENEALAVANGILRRLADG